MMVIGIDIGSRNTKLCLMGLDQKIIALLACATDISPSLGANALISKALSAYESKDYLLASTGYGRHLLKDADLVLSEISCHSAGLRFLHPECRTVIDIGGQDSKIISLDEAGKVIDFVMNDKCAAGTGRFLEMTAIRLGVDVSELSDIAAKSSTELKLSSTCVVFAESEIIGYMAASISKEDIIRAVHLSIAHRINAQIAPLRYIGPVYFTGGLAKSADLAFCLEQALATPILTSSHPDYTGAIGAAVKLWNQNENS